MIQLQDFYREAKERYGLRLLTGTAGLTHEFTWVHLCEDIGMAVVKFKNGAVGTIEGTTNVYPKNLEETLYLFGETGTVKIGGTSTNNIDVWNFSDETADDAKNNSDSDELGRQCSEDMLWQTDCLWWLSTE